MDEAAIPVKFQPFSSTADLSFWQALSKLKLESYQLSDAEQVISGLYAPTAHQDLPASIRVDRSSFEDSSNSSSSEWKATGILKNTNTLNEFKSFDKAKWIRDQGTALLDTIQNSRSTIENCPSLLCPISLLTYAELKKHSFVYWFAFPAIVPSQPFIQNKPPTSPADAFSAIAIENLKRDFAELSQSNALPSFFLVLPSEEAQLSSSPSSVKPLSDWSSLSPTEQSSVVFGFVDPCPLANHPGWPLRNFLIFITIAYQRASAKVFCYKEVNSTKLERSIILDIKSNNAPVESSPSVSGWEPNAKGKMTPRIMDLSAFLDPIRLSEASSDLNLKLMKWRQFPTLDTAKLASVSCLILGAGTLGCNVARGLLGWGVRHITLADNAVVSYSNPVRQSLFELSDVGKPKAETAADAIRRICPTAVATGHKLSILMPGHACSSTEDEACFEKLMCLVKEHDVIFLGTDSRESRWLPTVLCSALNKICINAALGFDTFVVMRHGAAAANLDSTEEQSPQRLGCYFCNDVVAPENSLRDRTLDQMCTVTRPGLAPMAGALAVELMVAILHDPAGNQAPAFDNKKDYQECSALGIIPHQVRGFLTDYRNVILTGVAFKQCTACSAPVTEAMITQGFEFMKKVGANQGVLEVMTGLDVLRQQTEALDFDDEEEDVDNFC